MRRRSLIAVVGAAAAIALPATALATDGGSSLQLEAATTVVPVDGWDGTVYPGDLGLYLANRGNRSFEVDFTKAAYGQPVHAFLVVHDGEHTYRRAIPDALISGFDGFAHVGDLTITDAAGNVIATTPIDPCLLGWNPQRLSPDAPATPSYPHACGYGNPFRLGNVVGIDKGWATSVDASTSFPGDTGRYHVHVALDPALADALGVPAASRAADVDLDVTMSWSPPPKAAIVAAAHGHGTTHAATRVHRIPKGVRRLHRRGLDAPDPKTLPDLVPLPAWGMSTSTDVGRDYLNFGANVWNAGPQRFTVEGYRVPGTDTMTAYQFTYRGTKAVGYAPIGTLAFDRRTGHDHWHFEDFARYDLLDANSSQVMVSGKQSFCIAPTDAIDLLRGGADWFPGNGDLGSACGGPGALWIREAMAVGWGDTYYQSKGGQAFDITALPNGTYGVRVTANPDRRVFERNYANDTSLRMVILGGDPGVRTVTVPPYMGIDTETPGPASP